MLGLLPHKERADPYGAISSALSQDCCIRSGLAVIASAGSTAVEQKVPEGIDHDVVADGELRKRRG
jgi:hypothetical protein